MNETVNFSIESFSVDQESRTITGVALPFGESMRKDGKFFTFVKGILSGVDTSKTKLRAEHDNKSWPVGKTIEATETDAGVEMKFKVYNTPRGTEALELAADGILSLSATLEYDPSKRGKDGSLRELIGIPEVSLTERPVFPSAVVTGVAFSESESSETSTATEPEELNSSVMDETITVDLSPIQDELKELRSDVVQLSTRIEAGGNRADIEAPSVDEYLAQLILPERRDAFRSKFERYATVSFALDDVVSDTGSISDLFAPRFYQERIQQVLNDRSPLFASFEDGSWEYSPTGYAIPYVEAGPGLVSGRGAQKSEIPSASFSSEARNFSNQTGAGGVDVSIESLQASPQTLNVVLRTLRNALARYKEAQAVTLYNTGTAGASVTGAALDTSSWEDFVKDVASENLVVKRETGAPARWLAVPDTVYVDLLALSDGIDRRMLAPSSDRSDGSASITSESFQIAGTPITVFAVEGLTRAALYNNEAIAATSGPVIEANAVTVAKMGVDYGIMQSFAILPVLPGGIRFYSVS